MRRTGGTRRVAVVVTTVAALLGMSLLAACGNPTTSVNRCQGASEDVMSAIQTKLTAKGKLRNAKLVRPKASPYTFVSAEIHLFEDAPHDDGDIATWATREKFQKYVDDGFRLFQAPPFIDQDHSNANQ